METTDSERSSSPTCPETIAGRVLSRRRSRKNTYSSEENESEGSMHVSRLKERRLSQMKERARSKRATETKEEHQQRVSQMKEQAELRRSTESEEEHQQRVSQMREQAELRRSTESEEEHQQRVSQMREQAELRRSTESEEEHQQRVSQMREQAELRRSTESEEEHQQRVSQIRKQVELRRSTESEEEHQQRVSQMREQAELRRSTESEEEHQQRVSQMREQAELRRSTESEEEHQQRVSQIRKQVELRRSTESEEEHQQRVSQMREQAELRRSTESEEEHQQRVSQMREQAELRRSTESEEEHQQRVSQMREQAELRRSTESEEEHQQRVSQIRKQVELRRSTESEEEHQHRLSQVKKQVRSRRKTETEQDHLKRLSQKRQQDRSRQAKETPEQHNSRVRQVRERRHTRTEEIGVALTNFKPMPNYLGKMNQQCSHCHVLHFAVETNVNGSYNSCCNHGKVELNQTHFSDYPELFHQLLTDSNKESLEFRTNIRNYNSSLALASMGAKLSVPLSRGPYCYKIHGQVYHNIGPLHSQDESKTYGQLYILDTDMAAAERMNNPANVHCDAQLMLKLGNFVANNNPYAKAYRMMYEIEEQERTLASAEGRSTKTVLMVFEEPTYKDRHRYNVPVANEVALIYVGDEVPESRSLAVHSHCNKLTPLSDVDKRCDPLTYPVFYPKGGFGWSINLQKKHANPKGRTRLTQREYYAFLLHLRNEFSPLFYGGKLFQQWIVDSWAKTEQNRLHYLRTHQSDLRADSYKNVTDHLTGDNPEDLLGMKVVLPSTFQSGPRGMQQNYQDAMAIVARFGKPDYFLTFTCSPKWLEMTEQFFANGQTAADRPDLIARVFELKLQELLTDLTTKKVIGEVLAYVYVVEFQKRGLPHCHMLLTMKPNWKPRCATDVDKIISAELPDELTDTKLHSLVSTLMIHRPCGEYNSHQNCMRDGVCTKHYPKPFLEQTQMKNNG